MVTSSQNRTISTLRADKSTRSVSELLTCRVLWSLQERVRHFASTLESVAMDRTLRQFGLGHAGRIHTYTPRNELRALFRLARACPMNSVVIEVGAYLGASTVYIAAGLSRRGGQIFCVDTWENETMPDGQRDTFKEFERNTEVVRHMIVPLRKRSTDVTKSDIPARAQLIFIDADHAYDSVRRDFEHYSVFLAEQGVMVFHDCNSHVGVTRVIGEALASEQWITLGKVGNLFWIGPRIRSA